MLSDRIGGILSIILGGVTVSEAIRLYPTRTDTFIGDHVMPGLVGGALIFLGLLLVFFIKGEKFSVEFPNRKLILSMLLTMGSLFVYWFIIPFLGYTISTLLVAIALFKVIGSFSIIKSTIYGLGLSAVFYLMFIYWLGMPFPSGIFNL